jgi:hypothetical protein
VDGNYSFTCVAGNVTVNKATPSVSPAASTNPAFDLNAVTFTATVSSPESPPSGSVSFYDGTTLLGPISLAAGLANYTTSSLTVGTHSITAAYSGDSNFLNQTSAVVTQTVEDFTVSLSTPGGGSVTVLPGASAAYSFQVAPSGGSTLPAAVTLNASGLPAGATAAFTPSTLSQGAGSSTVTLVIRLSNQLVSNAAIPLGGGLALAMMGEIILLPLGKSTRRPRAKAWRRAGLSLLFLAVACVALGLTACGGTGTGFFAQRPQSYLVTVTGTSGALSHAVTVILTVE